MFEDEIPWPRKGGKLFKADDDWWNNACLNPYSKDFYEYITGYKRAGDILVSFVKEYKSDQDTLVYPIVFLYRQYLELQLKAIIRDGNLLLNDHDGFDQIHEIDKLWRSCKIILIKVWPNSPVDDLNAVEEYILQFSNIDQFSFAFRYPSDRDGNFSLSDITYINLRNLADRISEIGSLLEGANAGIFDYLETKQEMERGLL